MIYAVDCSGGMPFERFDQIRADILADPEATWVITFDHQVTKTFHISEFRTAETWIYGGGGTLLSPVLGWAAAHVPHDEITVFSDGFFGEYKEQLKIHTTLHWVICASISNVNVYGCKDQPFASIKLLNGVTLDEEYTIPQ